MPTISMFYGVLIRTFFRDIEKHHLPYIHADYQDRVAGSLWSMAKNRFPSEGLTMIIAEIQPHSDWTLAITANNGRLGYFDVKPYLGYEAFEELRDYSEFLKVFNGGYFIEWECGADLSADTIEAGWHVQNSSQQATSSYSTTSDFWDAPICLS